MDLLYPEHGLSPEIHGFLKNLNSFERDLVRNWTDSPFERTKNDSYQLDQLCAKIPPLTNSRSVYRGLKNIT